MPWADVEQAVPSAKSIAWDGCHKIYVLLDDEETKFMVNCGYRQNDNPNASWLLTSEEITPEEMLKKLHEWFDNSCALRFISSVRTNHEDRNAGFTPLITQFEEGVK